MATPIMAGRVAARTATKIAVSVVVPTLNEAPNLAPLCERMDAVMEASGFADYEVVFVDDRSSDGTADVAHKLAADTDGRVRILERDGQRSLSGAVIDGFAAARGDVFVVMDADLQHPPDIVPSLLAAIDQGADLVVASRYVPGGDSELSHWRNLFSRVCTQLVRLCLGSGIRISDPLSGCFAMKRSVVDGSRLSPSGFKILMEVLACGNYRELREVPFHFVKRERGESKLGVATALRDFRGLMRAAREFRRHQARQK